MSPHSFVFIGRSGCGKGTQADLLAKHLEANDGGHPIVRVETGKLFRDFVKGDKHTHQLAKAIADRGGLQPEFLTVSMWSQYLVQSMVPDCHLIFDGTPRKFDEAHVLDTAFSFYGKGKPHIIFMDADRNTVVQRLLARGRSDDNPSDIENRLNWFESEVTKVVDYYRTNPNYHFVHVDSTKSIEEVFKDIVTATGLAA